MLNRKWLFHFNWTEKLIELCFVTSLEKPAIFQIIFNDNIRDGIKHKLNVVCVGGAGEVRVDLFLIFSFVKIFEFHSNVAWGFFVCIGT